MTKKILGIIAIGFSTLGFAQIQQGSSNVERVGDDIKEESVTVEREYKPKVEAAEKIKQTPQIAPVEPRKQELKYATKDVNAASDFETTTIAADTLSISRANPYNNYVRVGYGNQASLIADGYLGYEIDDTQSFGVKFDYFSTDAKIDNSLTDTNSSELNATVFYKKDLENAELDLKAGGGLQKVNFYGIHNNNWTQLEGRDVTDLYSDFQVSGTYKTFENLWLQNAKMKMNYFGGKFNANEMGADLSALFGNENLYELDALNGNIGITALTQLNILNTRFELEEKTKFSYFTAGINPMIHFGSDLLKLKAGINLQYNNESESEVNDTYFFPMLEVFVNAAPEFGIFGGIKGGLQQNSYQSMVAQNPYLYPELSLAPTVNNFEIYTGIRGEFGGVFKYNATAGYQDLDRILLFTKAPISLTSSSPLTFNEAPYNYGNVFQAVYDNGKRTYVQGQIRYLGIENLNLGLKLQFQGYSLDTQSEPWELPNLTSSVHADYKMLQEKLILGTDWFFVGGRKGLATTLQSLTNIQQTERVDLDAYVDLNLNATYMITPKWAAFVQANNLLNNNYDRFTDYQTQGFTVLGGVMFKFK